MKPLTFEFVLNDDRYRPWSGSAGEGARASATGFAFIGDEFQDSHALATKLREAIVVGIPECVALVTRLNGQFALVASTGDSAFAAVDRTRSIPLFFAESRDGDVLVGDALAVATGAGLQTLEQGHVDEFLLTGFVTGPDTMVRGLKQLQAGEHLAVNPGVEPTTARNYRYYPEELSSAPESELLEQWDDVLKAAAERLVKSFEGRPVVIPLSGGDDSRLVAAMLKIVGYDRITCYSYGSQNSKDVAGGREAAERLGLPWIHVSYSRSEWHDWYRSADWTRYSAFAGGFASLPHIDEWGALRKLKADARIDDLSIIVPGHTGDFISGGHTNYFFDLSGTETPDKLVRSIVNKHYGFFPRRLKDVGELDRYSRRILDSLTGLPLETVQELSSAYEYWEWQERQSKFIVNSVRGYDYWGFDWRIPLWDAEVMDFWRAVPYEFKVDRKLYRSHLSTMNPANAFTTTAERQQHRASVGGWRWLKAHRPLRLLTKQSLSSRKVINHNFGYYLDPLAVSGIHGYWKVRGYDRRTFTVNPLIADDYVDQLRSDFAGHN
jgi:asparagine synthase (glutamine-hydrolysing)